MEIEEAQGGCEGSERKKTSAWKIAERPQNADSVGKVGPDLSRRGCEARAFRSLCEDRQPARPCSPSFPHLALAFPELATQVGCSQWFLLASSLVKVQTNRTWLTGESPEAPFCGQQGEGEAHHLPGHVVTAPPQPSLCFGNQEGTNQRLHTSTFH